MTRKILLTAGVLLLLATALSFQNFASVPTGPSFVPVPKVTNVDCPYTPPANQPVLHR